MSILLSFSFSQCRFNCHCPLNYWLLTVYRQTTILKQTPSVVRMHADRLTHTHMHARAQRLSVEFSRIAKCHCVWFYHPLANKYFCCRQHQMIVYLMQLENCWCVECNHQWCGPWYWMKQVATSSLMSSARWYNWGYEWYTKNWL